MFWAVFISPCGLGFSSFCERFKVDPMKIGNHVHEIRELTAGTMNHKTNALSIDLAGKHSQAQIDGGNFDRSRDKPNTL